MQKKIIALAVAGLMSGAAFAQSNVTVYGVADMYYAYASGNNAGGQENSSHINSGGLAGSRIGFKGTEELGNGLKALFVLEYALALDQNTGIIGDQSNNNARQQLVGLTGNWGTVVAGYAQTAGYDFACATNPLAGGALDAQGKLGVNVNASYDNSLNLLACGRLGRSGNAVAYVSPNFSGFQFAYNHARVTENYAGNAPSAAAWLDGYVPPTTVLHGVDPTGSGDTYANLLHGTYANGPISAGLVYSKISGGTGKFVTDDVTEWGIRGSYDFGVAKLWAHWQKNKDDIVDMNNKKWSLSVSAPVTANGTVMAMYAKNSIDTANSDSKSWSLAYVHQMSKRTKLYGGYNRVTNDSAARSTSLVRPDAGDSSSAFVFGINHGF